MNPEYTLATRVLGKPEVTAEEIQTVLKLDMGFQVTEISISASETRQVRQYEPNTYFVGLKYDVNEALTSIAQEVATITDPTKRAERYFALKKILFQLISDKYVNGENYLRDLIKKQQENDGIKR